MYVARANKRKSIAEENKINEADTKDQNAGLLGVQSFSPPDLLSPRTCPIYLLPTGPTIFLFGFEVVTEPVVIPVFTGSATVAAGSWSDLLTSNSSVSGMTGCLCSTALFGSVGAVTALDGAVEALNGAVVALDGSVVALVGAALVGAVAAEVGVASVFSSCTRP